MVEDKKGIWYSSQSHWEDKVGGASLPEHWQTWKLHGEGRVRSAQWSSLQQTVVWLGIISVLPTQNILHVEKFAPKEGEGVN